MTTLDYLVNEVQSRALSGFREQRVVIAQTVDAAATTFTLTSGIPLQSIQPGATIQADYELLMVINIPNPTTLTVARGVLNSTAAPHNAGTIVVINPHFPTVDVVRAINEDIDDLSGQGLYQMGVATFTYNPAIMGYDLPGLISSEVIEITEVRTWDYGSKQAWPLIEPRFWKLERNASPTVFPSGMSLKLYQDAFPGRPVRVQYKAPYSTPLVNPSDDVEATTGLQAPAHDIPVLGSVYRLMMFRELKRSFTEAQGEPRRAQEVPVGSSLTALKGIQALRVDRINAERERLNRTYRRQRR
jgi:hypothetical protein